MTIKEAAVAYEVSRGKVHRMIRRGSLRTAKDPRDQRATLVRVEDLESEFRFPMDEVEDVTETGEEMNAYRDAGEITTELRARVEAIRTRVAARYGVSGDSVEIVREEREKRTRHIAGTD